MSVFPGQHHTSRILQTFPYHPAAIVPMLNPVEMAILNRSLSRSGMECGKTLHGG